MVGLVWFVVSGPRGVVATAGLSPFRVWREVSATPERFIGMYGLFQAREEDKRLVNPEYCHSSYLSPFVPCPWFYSVHTVQQAESAAASALYLDPSLQARASPKASGSMKNDGIGIGTSGTTISSGGGSGVGSNVDDAELETEDVRPPVGRTTEAANVAKKDFNQGPVVIMSDADNYRPDPKRRKAKKKKNCSIQ